MQLPSNETLSQLCEYNPVQWLCKNVCQLILCIDGKDSYGLVCHESSEMVILDGYVLRSGSKLWAFCNSDAAVVILKYFTMEYWLRVM